MTHTSWRDAASAICRKILPCDDEQRAIASAVGAQIPESLPRIVAAARVRSIVASRFGLTLRKSREYRQEFLAELAEEASHEIPGPESDEEAQSWIEYFYLRRRLEALRRLRLSKGDVVSRGSSLDQFDAVASIGDNGIVYFTGGRSRAWPDQLTIVARSADVSPSGLKAHRTAANRASERSVTQIWSSAKAASLNDYACSEDVSQEDIDILRCVIDNAPDERPIQELLQSRPQILSSLVSGHYRYCIPQVRLGGKYVADFLLAYVDSAGIHWILVELETPDSSVTLANGNEFDQHARKGVSQIKEWREWLQENLDLARRLRQENGLGLPDIRPRDEGMVLVGRRDRLRLNAHKLRRQHLEDTRIRIQTYDGLLERLEGILKFQGPWPMNPHALSRTDLLGPRPLV